jgi:hypothetical protein
MCTPPCPSRPGGPGPVHAGPPGGPLPAGYWRSHFRVKLPPTGSSLTCRTLPVLKGSNLTAGLCTGAQDFGCGAARGQCQRPDSESDSGSELRPEARMRTA